MKVQKIYSEINGNKKTLYEMDTRDLNKVVGGVIRYREIYENLTDEQKKELEEREKRILSA